MQKEAPYTPKLNKRSDLTNRRFGSLTALEPTAEKKNGYTVWRCRCDCGREVLIPSRYLKKGWRTDCGEHEKKKRYQDLTGMRFGKLVVMQAASVTRPDGSMEELRTDDGKVLWDCRCDCGNTIRVIGSQLTAGYRRSCNCLSRPPRKDWIGRRFGKLTVIAYDGKRRGFHFWKCRCECGGTSVVSQSNLKSGHTTSCGCGKNAQNGRHLIEGTCVEAIRSKTVFTTNTSGVRGVYPVRKTGKWAAQITFQGDKKYLGCFETITEAAQVRKNAEGVFEEFLDRYDAGEFQEQEMSAH
ncbi:MAG: hypothetical protein IJ860_07640 [Eubacterium sp.]|nr:hypothetical protein [Eubacterium sp.]